MRRLEEEIDAMDEADMYKKPDSIFTRDCSGEERNKLLSKIEGKFCEYGKPMCFFPSSCIMFNSWWTDRWYKHDSSKLLGSSCPLSDQLEASIRA